MYCVSRQVLYLGLRRWTSVRYILCCSSGIVPWATTMDFGQICIVFSTGNAPWATTVDYGKICIVFLLLYLGLRLWTSVRYVLCFSTGIVPWATTVDFGGVGIVFLFSYFTLGYDCGLRSDMYCVSLQLYFPLGYYSGPRSDVYCGFLQVLNHEIRLWIRSGMYCVSLHVLYLGLRLWTSVRYVLCFSTGILPWATTMDFGKVCIVFLFRYFILDTTVNFGQACIVFPLLYLGYSD